MTRLGWLAAGLACSALAVGLSQAASESAAPVEIGKAAPDFELKDVYGKSFKLSDFKGKIVVLEWVNQGCPVIRRCHDQKRMQKLYGEHADKVVWLAIDSTAGNKPDANRVYAARTGLAYPILHDTDGKVGKMYGARTTPHMFVVSADGKLIYDGALDDDPQGGKEKATNYVAEAISSAIDGKPVANSKTKPYGCGVKYPS